jgi:hypothetical protein
MKFAPLAIAVTLSVSALSASAVTQWGAHDPQEIGFGFAFGAGASLLDSYSFTLSEASSLTTTAVANDGTSLMLTNPTVDLFKGAVGSGTSLGQFGFGNTSSSFTFSSLGAGLYYYVVNAKVGPRAVAGSYALTSQVSPVPEPETYALMLAGLGAVCFIFLRRRNN